MLEFIREGGITMPRDRELHALAVEYADRELASPVNLADFAAVWLACELDSEGRPVRCLGIEGMVTRPDFPLMRFTHPAAARALLDRANDYLHDRGMRGAEVLVHLGADETEEQRCPEWREWLERWGAKPADRWAVVVR